MYKTTLFIALLFFTSLIQAQNSSPFYQIDLIVFSHEEASTGQDFSLQKTLSGTPTKPILLQTEISKHLSPYHLLPSSSSQLREEYWALHRRPQYRVLLNYTWLQPLNSRIPIALPKIQRDGWEIEGTINIQRTNYYFLNSEFLFSAPGGKLTPFVFAQRLRIKGGDIYYLDHPRAGMLIKVHQLT